MVEPFTLQEGQVVLQPSNPVREPKASVTKIFLV